MKTCNKCGVPKELSEFSKDAKMSDGLRSYCRSCGKKYWSEYRKENRESLNLAQVRRTAYNPQLQRARVRRSFFKRRYGLSLEQLDQMRVYQNNACPVCNTPFKPGWGKSGPQVDHDHKTGKIRSLLCTPCNTALGKLKDDFSRVIRLASYLLKFS